MKFFTISNNIFNTNLTPNEFLVYSYLCFRQGQSHSIILKTKLIGTKLNLTRPTILKAISGLIYKNLISKKKRYTSDGYLLASRYIVKNNIHITRFFKILTLIFNIKIKAVDFKIYSFILKCMDNLGEAFPSLSSIYKHINISRSRVVKGIKFLREESILSREKRLKIDKSHKQNKYTIAHKSLATTRVYPNPKKNINTYKKAGHKLLAFFVLNRHFFYLKIIYLLLYRGVV
ncbi:MAG: hypothetical protein KFW09_04250, partial [Oscillospiraceae bacterium]|nr:hypothetical protein [Oscillospiraceae bacterium]